MRLWPLVAVVLFTSSLAACGGAAYESKAPTAQPSPSSTQPAPEPEPATIEEANARIEQARSDLDQAFHPSQAQPTPSAPPSHVPTPGVEQPSATQSSPCEHACRAFASMERAVAAVCRLAGEADVKCTRARKVLDDNTARVKACACR